MPTAESLEEGKKLRDKVLFILGTRDATTTEIADALIPDAEHTNTDLEYGKLSRAMRTLEKQGKIKKTGGLRGSWHLKAKPSTHDLPAPPAKRGPYKKHSENGHSNGIANPLRAYLVREIRAKLDELEALG